MFASTVFFLQLSALRQSADGWYTLKIGELGRKENDFRGEELTMTARNGDKSRFKRERKQKVARRLRTRELLKMAAVDTSARAKPRSVSA